jgi:nucleoside-diphosphate-sugar epimerase
MRVLLTGAFGNIGHSTLDALLARGHVVRCFDVPTKSNQKMAGHYQDRAEVVWGDLRRPEDLCAAVPGCEAVIHLAFVIPKLSVTGINSEDQPVFAHSVNIGGTRNLIDCICAQQNPPKLIFASSLHIYGKTQHLAPPRRVDDEPHPIEHYARHKVEAEGMVKNSGLDWSILRLAAALPLRLIMDPGMFDVPLENRIEFIHTRDAGQAFANAIDQPAVSGKVLHIGGGRSCQVYYRGMMRQVLEAMGVGWLPDWAFSQEPFATDWLDTRESQALLQFQTRNFDDYTKDLKKLLGSLRGLIVASRPLVQRYLLTKSPYAFAAVQK